MKKQSTILLTQLGVAGMAHLTTVVAETLAMDLKMPATKVFTAAELWYIQKQKKAITGRRYHL